MISAAGNGPTYSKSLFYLSVNGKDSSDEDLAGMDRGSLKITGGPTFTSVYLDGSLITLKEHDLEIDTDGLTIDTFASS